MNVGSQLSALSAVFLLCLFPQDRGHCGLRVAGVALQLILPLFETNGPLSVYAAMDWDEEYNRRTNPPKLHRRRVGAAGHSEGESARRMQRQTEDGVSKASVENKTTEVAAPPALNATAVLEKEAPGAPSASSHESHSQSHSHSHQQGVSRPSVEDSPLNSYDSVDEEEPSDKVATREERRQITQKELQQQKEILKQKYGGH